MDTGHFNCRDYYVSEDVAYSTAMSRDKVASRTSGVKEQIDAAKLFPFLQLPLEIRQQIYSYLLPTTTVRGSTHSMANMLPFGDPISRRGRSSGTLADVVWKRGQTSLLCISRQVHDECAALLYGSSPFILFVKYDTINFRYSFLIPCGLAPSKQYEFLDLVPPRYLSLIRQVVVTVDHPDSYTGMIKYNVGGKGLTHGLRNQVQKLVDALRPHSEDRSGINSIQVILINGNKFMDSEKRSIVRAKNNEYREDEEVQTVLEPMAELIHITNVKLEGALTQEFAQRLQERMAR